MTRQIVSTNDEDSMSVMHIALFNKVLVPIEKLKKKIYVFKWILDLA